MANSDYQQRNEAVYNFLTRQGMGDQYQLSGGGHLMPSRMGMGSAYGRENSRALQTAYGLYDLGLLGPSGLSGGLGGGGAVSDRRTQLEGMLPGDWKSYAPWLEESMNMAEGLGREENLRRDQALGLMQKEGALANAAQRGMTPEEIAMRMGQVSDVATGESMRQMKGLRESLGSAGITGGGAAMGMAAGVELGRLGQIMGGRRQVAISEAERASQAAADRYMRSVGQAQFMAQGPSTKMYESHNAILDYLANVKLGEKGIEASKYAARKASKGAALGGFGSIVGSLIGGIFGR